MIKTISFLANVKTPIKASKNANFLTPKAKLTFLQLREVFIKAFIIYYFDLKCYIWIKIDTFDYSIDGILSQLIMESDQ